MQGRKIGNRIFYVSWDTDHARIEYTQDGQDGLKELCDKKDRPLEFDSELKAHQYLNKLGDESNDDWKEL